MKKVSQRCILKKRIDYIVSYSDKETFYLLSFVGVILNLISEVRYSLLFVGVSLIDKIKILNLT